MTTLQQLGLGLAVIFAAYVAVHMALSGLRDLRRAARTVDPHVAVAQRSEGLASLLIAGMIFAVAVAVATRL